MALCSSGSMSLGGSTVGRSVNCELGCSGTASINMNRADVRALAAQPSGDIAMSDFYGKSSGPSSFGESYGGGIYMGTICAAGSNYLLIVAPNATGCTVCQWKTTSLTCTSLSCSRVDGYKNTYDRLANAAHPAGNWCATRSIGGFSDWYLPGTDEQIEIYNNGGTPGNEAVMGSGEAFYQNFYWSSTEPYINPAYGITNIANYLYFSAYGALEYSGSKTYLSNVRAWRRESS